MAISGYPWYTYFMEVVGRAAPVPSLFGGGAI